MADDAADGGIEALQDRHLLPASNRAALVDEVMAMVDQYQTSYAGWNVRHCYTHYQRDGGTRSYSWVRTRLQEQGVVVRGRDRGKHHQRRKPSPCAGMMLHQDGSTHEWVPDQWWNLIVFMDDATNEHYSMFFCEKESLWSSLRSIRAVVETKGLCCSRYTDRSSHYWTTP